jgi:uncharacterized membrane protein
MKGLSIVGLLIMLLAGFALGDSGGSHSDFDAAKDLINNRVSCEDLSEQQMEMIGDYYMEQMHPGEAHEVMDKMMRGEGSETLMQMHIRMAKNFYCGDNTAMSAGMMNMMMGRSASNVAGTNQGGMMKMMGTGMMGAGSLWGGGFWFMFVAVFWIIVLLALILVVIWLYQKVAEPQKGGSAFEILKRRFAKGEINKKQYETMKKEINSPR